MNALFSKEQIFERITDSGYPFWTLWLVSGFQNKSHIMTYWGNDFNEIESDETKINKSIAKLESVIQSCPPDSVFSIEIKNAKTANGIGIIGPLQFSNSAAQTPQTAVQNVAGLAGVPAGYMPDSVLDGIKRQMQDTFDLKLEYFKNEALLREREYELRRKEQELKDKLKECAELKKGYDSGVARTADVLMLAGTRLIKIMFPALIPSADAAASLGNVPEQPRAKAQPQPQPQPQPQTQQPPQSEPDPKADEVDEVAEFIYNNFSIEQIKDFKKRLYAKQSENLQGEDEYDTDDSEDE